MTATACSPQHCSTAKAQNSIRGLLAKTTCTIVTSSVETAMFSELGSVHVWENKAWKKGERAPSTHLPSHTKVNSRLLSQVTVYNGEKHTCVLA